MQKQRIEELHHQMQRKAISHWMREQRGRFHCLVFSSPAKPKLQAKENFLVAHMGARDEPVSFNSDGSVLKATES